MPPSKLWSFPALLIALFKRYFKNGPQRECWISVQKLTPRFERRAERLAVPFRRPPHLHAPCPELRRTSRKSPLLRRFLPASRWCRSLSMPPALPSGRLLTSRCPDFTPPRQLFPHIRSAHSPLHFPTSCTTPTIIHVPKKRAVPPFLSSRILCSWNLRRGFPPHPHPSKVRRRPEN